jgi:hypothetical protein
VPFSCHFIQYLGAASSTIRVPYLFGISGQFIHSSSVHSFIHSLILSLYQINHNGFHHLSPAQTFFNFVVLICSLIINYFLFPCEEWMHVKYMGNKFGFIRSFIYSFQLQGTKERVFMGLPDLLTLVQNTHAPCANHESHYVREHAGYKPLCLFYALLNFFGLPLPLPGTCPEFLIGTLQDIIILTRHIPKVVIIFFISHVFAYFLLVP